LLRHKIANSKKTKTQYLPNEKKVQINLTIIRSIKL